MRIFSFTFALVGVLISVIYAKPQPQSLPNPIEAASNVANRFGQIPQDFADMGLSQMENALNQAKKVVNEEKNSGLLQNFVPRIDNMINTIRKLAKDLTLGISEVGFKSVLGLPSDDDK